LLEQRERAVEIEVVGLQPANDLFEASQLLRERRSRRGLTGDSGRFTHSTIPP
jgi:hypothetical protein